MFIYMISAVCICTKTNNSGRYNLFDYSTYMTSLTCAGSAMVGIFNKGELMLDALNFLSKSTEDKELLPYKIHCYIKTC